MIDPFEGMARTMRRFRLEDDIALLEQRLRELHGADRPVDGRHLEVLGERLAHRRAELADIGGHGGTG